MFDLGQWAIDTKKKMAVTIMAQIFNGYASLYIVQGDDGYYIVDEEDLIKYDKYYFDSEEGS